MGHSFAGRPSHVFYVWFDALTGYMSGVSFKSTTRSSAILAGEPAPGGKDILRFHTVIGRRFCSPRLEPPRSVFGHGWWLFKEEKMSKSRGNVLDPYVLVDTFGSELLRYYLLREMVFGQDCNFSFDAVIQRANSDLANDLGNLLSRTTAMITKYRSGRIPSPAAAKGDEDVRATARV
jgi:methionyl-tRNA synthetase